MYIAIMNEMGILAYLYSHAGYSTYIYTTSNFISKTRCTVATRLFVNTKSEGSS